MAPFFLAALLALAPGPASDERTDLVVLANGNELLGEIKSMSRGRLTYKTDSAGTLKVEWDEVLRLTSKRRFLLELVDGSRRIGTFLDPPREQVLLLQASDGTQTIIPFVQVARFQEFETSAWERLDGYVNAGFSYTKSSSVGQYSFGAGFEFLDRDRFVSFDLSAIATDQKSEETAKKADLSASYRRLLRRRWFGMALFDLTHSSELGIKVRATLGAGPGRYLVQSQSQELAVFGGLAYNYEVPKGGSSTGEAELVLGTTYDIFILDTPETTLGLDWTVFPGLTDSGRLRSKLNLDLNKELVEDFFFTIGFYLDYDSDPASDDGSESDYGVVSGLSYTF